MVSISILQEYEKIQTLIDKDRCDNKEIKHQEVKILGTWGTDYGDIGCQAILYKDGKKVANIMDSDEETTIRYVYGNNHSELTEELVKASFESLINDNFDKYLELPKISECSELLQQIYDYVCESEASMCHIDYDDWLDWIENFDFKEDDIEVLKNEIKKYNLEEIIGLDDGEYKIIGYGNLQFRFNDDRDIVKEINVGDNFEI